METKHLGLLAVVALVSCVVIRNWFNNSHTVPEFRARTELVSYQPEPVVNAIFQQDVDHFGNDDRAMSPRNWGNFYQESGNEPQAPAVTFDNQSDRIQRESSQEYDQNQPPEFQQVESSRILEPKKFYETKPLDPEIASDSSNSSPLPLELKLQDQDQDAQHRSAKPTQLNAKDPEPNSDRQSSDKSVESPTRALSSNPSNESSNRKMTSRLESSHDKSAPRSNAAITIQPSVNGNAQPGFNITEYPLTQLPPMAGSNRGCDCYRQDDCQSLSQYRCPRCRRPQRNPRRQIFRTQIPTNIGLAPTQDHPCIQPNGCGCGDLLPKYNQHLGHRYEAPIDRGFLGSSAEKFTFEEDGEFPPVSEILANSVFFSEFEFMFLQPAFQGNTAITTTNPTGGFSSPFNFDLEPGFRVMAGFESEYGPGFAGDYFQFDNNSDTSSFVSDGVSTGETRVYQLGPNRWTSLLADDPGESLDTFHSLEVHSTSVYAFKAIKFKRAYVNGRFGIQIATIDQKLHANLFDSGGNRIGRLSHFSNLNAFGPKFGIDYVRRIGHTPAQLVTSATTSLLFGDRDQRVENTLTGEFNRVGADEFLAVFDIFFGVQGKQIRGEKRNTTFRVGFVNQTWIGGGTAVDPNGDFGFQGISMMLGFNR